MDGMSKKYSLSFSYWIAFVILAVWVTIAYFTMHALIESQQTYGTLINLSGKQRMLSQRTALYAHLTTVHRADAAALVPMVRMMEEDHAFITAHLTSDRLRAYYFGENGLDGQVRRYIALLEAFVSDPSETQLEKVTAASTPLLVNLNEAVSIFEKENSAIVDALEQRELMVYIGTLLTLLLEAVVIILPMIRLHVNYLGTLEEEVRRQTDEIRIFANMFEHSNEGMIIADEHQIIINVNRAFTEITGYSAEEAVGRPMNFRRSGRHDEAFYAQMWKAITEDQLWQGEIINVGKNGRQLHEHHTIMKLTDGGTLNYVTVFTDETERVHYEEELHYMANHDSLTGMLNRSEILNRLDHAIALADRSRLSLAVVFVDLDNFKLINDSLGHAVGDRLLVEISSRLAQSVRGSDTLGRLGGDEFVILIESLEQRGEERVLLKKLHSMFERPVEIDGRILPVSASLGVVHYPDGERGGGSAERLIRKADIAMYRAKELGKNQVVYYNEALEAKIHSRLLVKHRLTDAIDNRELELYLQPKIELSSGSICGAEALLRWHRDGETIAPLQFIPVAEEDNLIKKIDLWAAEEAVRLLGMLHAEGYSDLSIALNVSGKTFSDHGMMETMLDIIEKSGMAHHIELEITERVLIENLLFASGIIDKIKAVGAAVSLDDFGTGYSSFSYLGKFPLDSIKIDASFIASLHQPKPKILVEAIISFCDKFGMSVVAEGIETDAQLQWLKEQRCDFGQGYLFGKPLPFGAFKTLLASWRR